MENRIYLKKPSGEKDNFPKFIDTIKKDIQSGRWVSVIENTEKAETAFKIVKKRIQFNVERDEMNKIDENLVRVKGYALAENKAGALAEIASIINHWEHWESRRCIQNQ